MNIYSLMPIQVTSSLSVDFYRFISHKQLVLVSLEQYNQDGVGSDMQGRGNRFLGVSDVGNIRITKVPGQSAVQVIQLLSRDLTSPGKVNDFIGVIQSNTGEEGRRYNIIWPVISIISTGCPTLWVINIGNYYTHVVNTKGSTCGVFHKDSGKFLGGHHRDVDNTYTQRNLFLYSSAFLSS